MGTPDIHRVDWPHARTLSEEYFLVIQGFEVIRGELMAFFRDEEKKADARRKREQATQQSRQRIPRTR